MTIKELEERLGLPRASIRYYEQEGLLTPARGANGYRNYSEEDLRTLEKIKLLRQLHLDLETIRALQRGELTLDAALARQLAGLGEDRAALDRAEAVCRALRDAGESYAKLDPKPWLDQLTRPPLPAAPHFPPPAETRRAPEPLPVAPCPIRRWLARWLDLGLYGLPWILLRSLALHVPSVENGVLSWLEGYLSIALMFLLEPLLLHYWGWTPGKWLLGLKVRDRAGEKLSLKRAFQRIWRLFGRGYGYQIPIYNLYRMWRSYRACREGEYLEWDQDPDLPAQEDIRYEMLPLKALKGLGYGAAQAALLGCTVLAVLAGMVPPVRGTLTEAELIRNYNHVNRVYGLEAPEMEPDGMLGENPNLGLAAWGWYTPTVTLAEQDGVVTGFAVAWKNVPTWNTYHTPSMAAPAALGGALLAERADLGPVSYQTAMINYIKALAELTLADAMAGKTVTAEGLELTIEVNVSAGALEDVGVDGNYYESVGEETCQAVVTLRAAWS